MTNYNFNLRQVVTIIFTSALISQAVFADPENNLSNDELQDGATETTAAPLGIMTPSIDSIDGTGRRVTTGTTPSTDSIDGTGRRMTTGTTPSSDSIDGTGRLNSSSTTDFAASGVRLHTVESLDSELQNCEPSTSSNASEEMVSAAVDSTNCLPSSSFDEEHGE